MQSLLPWSGLSPLGWKAVLRFPRLAARSVPKGDLDLCLTKQIHYSVRVAALAAALAIAAPVWAQAPTNPNPAGAPSTSQAAPYTQEKPTRPTAPSAAAPAPYSTTENATEPTPKRRAGHMRSAHRMRHAPSASRGSRAPTDNIANQLNSQELSRLSGSGAPPAGYAPRGNPQQGQPQQGQPPSGPRY